MICGRLGRDRKGRCGSESRSVSGSGNGEGDDDGDGGVDFGSGSGLSLALVRLFPRVFPEKRCICGGHGVGLRVGPEFLQTVGRRHRVGWRNRGLRGKLRRPSVFGGGGWGDLSW